MLFWRIAGLWMVSAVGFGTVAGALYGMLLGFIPVFALIGAALGFAMGLVLGLLSCFPFAALVRRLVLRRYPEIHTTSGLAVLVTLGAQALFVATLCLIQASLAPFSIAFLIFGIPTMIACTCAALAGPLVVMHAVKPWGPDGVALRAPPPLPPVQPSAEWAPPTEESLLRRAAR